MTSVLNVDTIADKAGTGPVELTKQQAAKSWLNFTGITTTAARDSFNFSSLTDAGTGQTFPISFTNNMGNGNYSGSYFQNATSSTSYKGFNNDYAGNIGTLTTASYGTYSFAQTDADSERNLVIIIGDLA